VKKIEKNLKITAGKFGGMDIFATHSLFSLRDQNKRDDPDRGRSDDIRLSVPLRCGKPDSIYAITN